MLWSRAEWSGVWWPVGPCSAVLAVSSGQPASQPCPGLSWAADGGVIGAGLATTFYTSAGDFSSGLEKRVLEQKPPPS